MVSKYASACCRFIYRESKMSLKKTVIGLYLGEFTYCLNILKKRGANLYTKYLKKKANKNIAAHIPEPFIRGFYFLSQSWEVIKIMCRFQAIREKHRNNLRIIWTNILGARRKGYAWPDYCVSVIVRLCKDHCTKNEVFHEGFLQ